MALLLYNPTSLVANITNTSCTVAKTITQQAPANQYTILQGVYNTTPVLSSAPTVNIPFTDAIGKKSFLTKHTASWTPSITNLGNAFTFANAIEVYVKRGLTIGTTHPETTVTMDNGRQVFTKTGTPYHVVKMTLILKASDGFSYFSNALYEQKYDPLKPIGFAMLKDDISPQLSLSTDLGSAFFILATIKSSAFNSAFDNPFLAEVEVELQEVC